MDRKPHASPAQPHAATEDGFGLIELLIALVMLNVGILALLGSFQSSALAVERAAATSNGSAIADRVMEVYRGLESKAIYLNAPAANGGNDVAGWPNGIPNSTSAFYAAYSADAGAYGGSAYYSYATPSSTPLWVSQSSTGTAYPPIPPSTAGAVPAGLSIDPTKAVQGVAGPDGQTWTVFTYIVIAQPSGAGWTGGYVKRVTVEVLNPRTSVVVARESSLFDPGLAP